MAYSILLLAALDLTPDSIGLLDFRPEADVRCLRWNEQYTCSSGSYYKDSKAV